jgi:hypothetical protein
VLDSLGADERLKTAAIRNAPLEAYPPPGAREIVTHYRSESDEVAAHA